MSAMKLGTLFGYLAMLRVGGSEILEVDAYSEYHTCGSRTTSEPLSLGSVVSVLSTLSKDYVTRVNLSHPIEGT